MEVTLHILEYALIYTGTYITKLKPTQMLPILISV